VYVVETHHVEHPLAAVMRVNDFLALTARRRSICFLYGSTAL
jgi:hypothetical protein